MSASSSLGASAAAPATSAHSAPEGAHAVEPAASTRSAEIAPPSIVDTEAKTPLIESIRLLKEQQKKMREEKTRIQNELRNAERRRRRLKKRARQLTDDDLVEVLKMRQTPEDDTATKDMQIVTQSDGASSSSSKD